MSAASPFATSRPDWHRLLAGRGGLEFLLVHAALLLVVAQALYPLVWVLFGSLKSKSEIIGNVWGPPLSPILGNYAEAWAMADMGSRILNSLFVTGAALAILVAVATPCAYAVTRLKFPGRAAVIAAVVAAMLVPPQVMAIPLFMVARDLGLIDSLPGIALIYAASALPLAIFILRGFFLTLPMELEDAARMDGASRFATLAYVMLPLVRPGIALVVIFGFIEIWNDFFLAFLLLRRPELQTIPLGLVSFFQQYDSLWNLYFAALMITTLPVVAVFLLMQRQFIAGLTAGAVKA